MTSCIFGLLPTTPSKPNFSSSCALARGCAFEAEALGGLVHDGPQLGHVRPAFADNGPRLA